MPNLLALIERGVVRPESAVTKRFSLEGANDAYGELDQRAIVGRAIVVPGS
jgi:S-(hydroxymethyl)glutathione dehydrogenase/alcohol dehydrogenase